MESKAAHAARILRTQPARNTGQAKRRGDGREGRVVPVRRRPTGDEKLHANARLATRGSFPERGEQRGTNSLGGRIDERAAKFEPPPMRDEVKLPTGPMHQTANGVTPNAVWADRVTSHQVSLASAHHAETGFH
jgi:hypothetical protein